MRISDWSSDVCSSDLVLADIIDSNKIAVAHLTEVFRQAALSKIITNAHRVNQGFMTIIPDKGEASDYYFIGAQAPEDCIRKHLEVVSQRMPQRFNLTPINDIHVLCSMNSGGVGDRSLHRSEEHTIELQ